MPRDRESVQSQKSGRISLFLLRQLVAGGRNLQTATRKMPKMRAVSPMGT